MCTHTNQINNNIDDVHDDALPESGGYLGGNLYYFLLFSMHVI